jgi:hypothetical protein
MGVYVVLVNNTRRESIMFEGKLGEGQTVKGVLQIVTRLGWSLEDNIEITGDDYMDEEQREYVEQE